MYSKVSSLLLYMKTKSILYRFYSFLFYLLFIYFMFFNVFNFANLQTFHAMERQYTTLFVKKQKTRRKTKQTTKIEKQKEKIVANIRK